MAEREAAGFTVRLTVRLILAAIAGAWLALPSAGLAQSENEGSSGRGYDRYQTRERPLDRPARDDPKAAQRDRALDRCNSQHGIDCDTPEGQREWLLQERTRREAVDDGSRRRVPAQR